MLSLVAAICVRAFIVAVYSNLSDQQWFEEIISPKLIYLLGQTYCEQQCKREAGVLMQPLRETIIIGL